MIVAIIDGYTDEPAGLGVPPYIGLYPRYAYGAIKKARKDSNVFYLTIDDLRATFEGEDGIRTKNKTPNFPKVKEILKKAEIIVFIGGLHTPGKYLSAVPGTVEEVAKFIKPYEGIKILGGPAFMGSAKAGGIRVTIKELKFAEEVFDYVVYGDLEAFLFDYLSGREIDPFRFRNYEELRDYALLGAEVVKQFPGYPEFVLAEIETQRGCPKAMGIGGCSFCTEPVRYPVVENREQEDVAEEIRVLYSLGIRHFRIGRQSCIFSYKAKPNGRVPIPNPDEVEKLFRGVRNAAPNAKTIHVDNANPAVIANYPDEARRIAKAIIKYGTPGNVVAFGLETADPRVARLNNLNATPEETYEAVKIINEVGARRGYNGLPWLLPGINIIFGLPGETKRTYELTYEFLKKILDDGLMVRRINIRQVVVFPGTPLWNMRDKVKTEKHKDLIKHYRHKIRHEIDLPMLKRVVPVGTVLKDVRMEIYDGNLTFGRQFGSYPLIVGVPKRLELDRYYDVMIVDHGLRSVTGIPVPIDVNRESSKVLGWLPGLGKKTLAKILAKRPFKSEEEFLNLLPREFREMYKDKVKFT
ncbi:radical SAM protein [Pyrococcus abyssi]|uniref:Fe-S oxidoreductase, putative n=1 Tax=Pyrococcus abyssi (strain GE5 / Orsay) TaxID=272844 RepID=Q9V2H5_PYRAB|nr:radical SAM protein [Pyrococcus abyssi]CAB49023.1 Fe-S oxidoreductase, putative [Pyrococcus abyssi GE5]CCE69475.1 TPA: putative oxidative cyclase [Pyrococcus abyssi GE5]